MAGVCRPEHSCNWWVNQLHQDHTLWQNVIQCCQTGVMLWSLTTMTRWCSGRALDWWSIGHGFDSGRGIIGATTLGKLFTPNVPLFTKQYNLVPCEGLLVKSAVLWQWHVGPMNKGGIVEQFWSDSVKLQHIQSQYRGMPNGPKIANKIQYI